ncbi:MAG: BrnT family toxin [Chloroflexia bacterium]|nr:BrnT family toxin [Chloroflexia bacterium]
MEFEWDEVKRQSNITKHDIDFQQATALFDGRPVFVAPSPYTYEERFRTTGEFDDLFITVIWTYRTPKIRIISARKARHGERREYRELHDG